jgi:hypothetical protein
VTWRIVIRGNLTRGNAIRGNLTGGNVTRGNLTREDVYSGKRYTRRCGPRGNVLWGNGTRGFFFNLNINRDLDRDSSPTDYKYK